MKSQRDIIKVEENNASLEDAARQLVKGEKKKELAVRDLLGVDLHDALWATARAKPPWDQGRVDTRASTNKEAHWRTRARQDKWTVEYPAIILPSSSDLSRLHLQAL